MFRKTLATVADPRIRPAGPEDRDLLAAFLTGLSPESSQRRFLTGPSGAPSAKMLAALLPEPPAGGALLAFLDDEVVGHGLWVRLRNGTTAEIALVVADRHQRRGIGTALARALIDDLAAHGVTDVEVFSSTSNRAVARMVARRAPDARRELDGPESTYFFPARSSRSGTLPRTA